MAPFPFQSEAQGSPQRPAAWECYTGQSLQGYCGTRPEKQNSELNLLSALDGLGS